MCNEHIPLSAVLFDMDGVLIDSNPVIERAWTEAAAMYGIDISNEDIVQHIHGQPGHYTIRALFGHLPLHEQNNVQNHVIYVENTAEYAPIPGVAKLIASLHSAGVTVGIVTSGWKEKIERVAAMLDISQSVSVIVERDDVERGKPFPDPYLVAARRLNIPARNALVFEDSVSGVTSAVAAGAYCVGLGAAELLKHGARLTLQDFTGVAIAATEAGKVVMTIDSQTQLELKSCR
ncbi:HAD family hydrolase [Enterobacter sp. BNK-22]|uniref:HAD family hydrolase n=1 Tax=Enterobacter sp. BNK-22 TaxID=3376157 RepID=UPI003B50A4D2